jgi:DNA-binding MarR family transcriptional regulator
MPKEFLLMDREALTRLSDVFLFLNSQNKLLTARQLGTLLHVAGTPGLSMTEIADRSGQTLATISRHVRALRTYPQGQPNSIAWVEWQPAIDARVRPLWLSKEGQRIVSQMMALVNAPERVR